MNASVGTSRFCISIGSDFPLENHQSSKVIGRKVEIFWLSRVTTNATKPVLESRKKTWQNMSVPVGAEEQG